MKNHENLALGMKNHETTLKTQYSYPKTMKLP